MKRGRVARNEATARSDINLFATTADDARCSLRRIVEGVPVEMSFDSATRWRDQLVREVPVVVHAFASGRALLDSTGALKDLCGEAAEIWSRGPTPLNPASRLGLRFHLTDAVRDLEDAPADPAVTALPAAVCVQLAIDAVFALESKWGAPPRHAVRVLREFAPDLASQIEACASSGFAGPLAVEVADRVLARLGGRLEEYDTTSVT